MDNRITREEIQRELNIDIIRKICILLYDSQIQFQENEEKNNKQISNYQKEIQSKNKIITSLESELSDIKSKLEDEIKQSNILKAEISDLKQNSNSPHINIENVNENSDLKEKCKRQENFIEILKVRLVLLQNDLDKLQNCEKVEILKENETLVETIEELRRESELAHQYEEDYDELESRHESILDELEQIQKEKIELLVQVKDLDDIKKKNEKNCK